MSGIELKNDTLLVDRDPNLLDQLAIDVSTVLSELDVDHVLVAGYVAILAGRPRGTEDIDVLIEELDEEETDRLANALQDAGFWESAMRSPRCTERCRRGLTSGWHETEKRSPTSR